MWIPMETMRHIRISFRRPSRSLAKEQRKLSHCEQGSHRYKKRKEKVARIHTHIAHQAKGFSAQKSRKITNSYDMVCIERSEYERDEPGDALLGRVSMTMAGECCADFLACRMEATASGKELVRTDRWYPSSKTCSCCGKDKGRFAAG